MNFLYVIYVTTLQIYGHQLNALNRIHDLVCRSASNAYIVSVSLDRSTRIWQIDSSVLEENSNSKSSMSMSLSSNAGSPADEGDGGRFMGVMRV